MCLVPPRQTGTLEHGTKTQAILARVPVFQIQRGDREPFPESSGVRVGCGTSRGMGPHDDPDDTPARVGLVLAERPAPVSCRTATTTGPRCCAPGIAPEPAGSADLSASVHRPGLRCV